MSIRNNTTSLQELLEAVNNLPNAGSGEQATPVISVNSTNGLITATAGAKTSTHQLAFQPAKTITPSTASQIAVSSGYYTGGNITVAAVPTQTKSVTPKATSQNVTPDSGKFLSKVTVAGDSNLVAGNIKSGVSIFGVSGTLKEGSGSSDNYYEKLIPLMKTIGSSAFMNCSNLTTASFPACTSIGANAFMSCSNLTTVSFPACTRIDINAFSNCKNLTTVNFPACKTIYNCAFMNCSNLTTASFPACTSIYNSVFYMCKNLKSLYLTGSSLCILGNSKAFGYTRINGYYTGDASIYVPASLLTSYQTTTNWTYFSSRFVGI